MIDIRKKLTILFPELRRLVKLADERNLPFYIVGGAIRDVLLGLEPKDLDMIPVKPGPARELVELFAEEIGGTLVTFQSRGNVFRIIHRGRSFDFTELQGDNLTEDLKRRDFSINSLGLCAKAAVEGSSELQVMDPMGGLKDLEARLVKVNDQSVYDEDPLRIIRFFRVAYKLGFDLDPYSYRLIPQKLHGLEKVSVERIHEELMELMSIGNTSDALRAMDGVGLVAWLFPAVEEAKGFPQNDYHHLDVFSHTLEAIEYLDSLEMLNDPRLLPFKDRVMERLESRGSTGQTIHSLAKLSMLLHDLGKPGSASYDDEGRLHFIHHEKLSAEFAEEYLAHYKFGRKETKYIISIVKGHMRPGQIKPDSPNVHKQIYRYFREFGPTGVELALFSLADRLAARGTRVTNEMIDGEFEICALLFETFFNKAQLIVRPPKLLNGNILIQELGVEPGPRVGILLDQVEEAQVDGRVNNLEEAKAYARELIASFSDSGTLPASDGL